MMSDYNGSRLFPCPGLMDGRTGGRVVRAERGCKKTPEKKREGRGGEEGERQHCACCIGSASAALDLCLNGADYDVQCGRMCVYIIVQDSQSA